VHFKRTVVKSLTLITQNTHLKQLVTSCEFTVKFLHYLTPKTNKIANTKLISSYRQNSVQTDIQYIQSQPLWHQ